MAYKLVCIDMDGTLLDSHKQVSELTKAVLQEAYKRGIHIAISTGRTCSDVEYYVNLIGVRGPIIAANGAYIQDAEQDKLIYQNLLGRDLALKIIDVCEKYHIAPSFHTPQKEYYGGIYLLILWPMFHFIIYIRRKRARYSRRFIAGYKQWKKIIAEEEEHIVKCMIIHFNQKKIRKIREALSQIAELEATSSAANIIELNCQGITKGKGVEMLARYYDLKKEEIIAIGDSENDLSMIEYAGLGVAMGNADDIVKEKADYITDTNDHDGVAKVLQKFVLNPFGH